MSGSDSRDGGFHDRAPARDHRVTIGVFGSAAEQLVWNAIEDVDSQCPSLIKGIDHLGKFSVENALEASMKPVTDTELANTGALPVVPRLFDVCRWHQLGRVRGQLHHGRPRQAVTL